MIFPEATTHSREVLLHFKKGAFLPGLPVQVHTLLYGSSANWDSYVHIRPQCLTVSHV